jgi:hypothetical protein
MMVVAMPVMLLLLLLSAAVVVMVLVLLLVMKIPQCYPVVSMPCNCFIRHFPEQRV